MNTILFFKWKCTLCDNWSPPTVISQLSDPSFAVIGWVEQCLKVWKVDCWVFFNDVFLGGVIKWFNVKKLEQERMSVTQEVKIPSCFCSIFSTEAKVAWTLLCPRGVGSCMFKEDIITVKWNDFCMKERENEWRRQDLWWSWHMLTFS